MPEVVFFILDLVGQRAKLFGILEDSVVEFLLGELLETLLLHSAILLPSVEGKGNIAFDVLAPVGGESEPVFEQLSHMDELPPSIEHFGFSIQVLIIVLHPPNDFQHQPILFLYSLIQCLLNILFTIPFLPHQVLIILQHNPLLEYLLPHWPLIVHLLTQLIPLRCVLPPLEVHSHLVADIMQDSIGFIYILFVSVQCPKLELGQVGGLAPEDQVVQDAVDVLGREGFLLVVDELLGARERHDGVVAEFEGLVVVDVGEVGHPGHEVLRVLE